MKLTVVPCELGEANAFVARHHRHHFPVPGHKFSIAVVDEDAQVCGVAIVGRPMSLESTAEELRVRANDLRRDTNWDRQELASHLSAMATELEEIARGMP